LNYWTGEEKCNARRFLFFNIPKNYKEGLQAFLIINPGSSDCQPKIAPNTHEEKIIQIKWKDDTNFSPKDPSQKRFRRKSWGNFCFTLRYKIKNQIKNYRINDFSFSNFKNFSTTFY